MTAESENFSNTLDCSETGTLQQRLQEDVEDNCLAATDLTRTQGLADYNPYKSHVYKMPQTCKTLEIKDESDDDVTCSLDSVPQVFSNCWWIAILTLFAKSPRLFSLILPDDRHIIIRLRLSFLRNTCRSKQNTYNYGAGGCPSVSDKIIERYRRKSNDRAFTKEKGDTEGARADLMLESFIESMGRKIVKPLKHLVRWNIIDELDIQAQNRVMKQERFMNNVAVFDFYVEDEAERIEHDTIIEKLKKFCKALSMDGGLLVCKMLDNEEFHAIAFVYCKSLDQLTICNWDTCYHDRIFTSGRSMEIQYVTVVRLCTPPGVPYATHPSETGRQPYTQKILYWTTMNYRNTLLKQHKQEIEDAYRKKKSNLSKKEFENEWIHNKIQSGFAGSKQPEMVFSSDEETVEDID